MTDRSLPKLVQDLLYAAEHGLADDDIGRAAVTAIQSGVGDEFTRGIIEERVQRHRVASAFQGCFPVPRLGQGQCVLGLDAHGQPIRTPVDSLNAHSLTLGGSGSGKTTKSLFMALQVVGLVPGVWLFDLRKREFAVLRQYVPRLGRDLLIVPARQLKLNPLQLPVGVGLEDWAPRVADMLVQALELPPRATKLIHTTVIRLCRKFGSRSAPTLFDLRESIASDRSLNAPAREAIVDSLDPVLESIGDVFKYRRGWNTAALARRHIVFELSGVSELDKNLILNSLVLPEFTSRVARGVSNPHMDLWICLDEAQRLVSTQGSRGGVADLIGLIRGSGIGLDLSVQSGDISPSILSNTAIKCIGRCGSAADYDLISSAMGLAAEQRQWMRQSLRPGMFVMQLGEGLWRRPFVCTIPPMTLDRAGMEDCYLGDLERLPVERASEFDHWDPDGITKGPGTQAAPEDALSEADLRFLRAVVDHPGQPSSSYAKLAGLSPSRATAIRIRLESLGYLRVHEVATSGRGRNAKVVEPLEPAIRAVREESSR